MAIMTNIALYSHYPSAEFDDAFCASFQMSTEKALALVGKAPRGEDPSCLWDELDSIEVSFLNDEDITRIHRDFMDLDTPTDVITFHHGEILISLDTAKRQAEEQGEPFMREVFRYIVHGLLHLRGYLDYTEPHRAHMFGYQEDIVAKVWTPEGK